ncbi:MAG: cation:proton antiporter, partial [Terriglobia bacterium]
LRDLVILFGFAALVAVVLQRARQSTIVAYLITGVLVGPSGLGLITSRAAIELMAEIGVALLLFTIGIEFSLKKLLRMRQVVLGAGSRQVVLTGLVTLGAATLLGYNWPQGVLWSFLITASSTAIVLKLLFDRQELETPHGRAVLGVLLFQDICVVPMMALVPALTAASTALALAILYALGKSLALVILILAAGRYFFPPLWRHIVFLRNKEIFLIASIFFALGTAWVASLAGLSLAIGAFLAGLALSESEYAHQILSDFLPFRDSFNSLFFISIGMLVDLKLVQAHWVLVVGLAAGIFLLKAVTGTGSVLILGFPLRMSLLVGLALAQVGEFSFILLQQGAALGLVSARDYQVFLTAAVVTMILTPIVIQLSPRLAARLPELPRRYPFSEPGEAELEQRAPALRNHVILCGYGLNGRMSARVLRQAGISYLVLDMNPETVRRAAAEGEPIFFGDGSRREILEKAGAARARAIVYAISDPFVLDRAVSVARATNPSLTIIARTKRFEDAAPLERAGANYVVPEEFVAAEEIIVRLLGLFGLSRREAVARVSAVDAEKELKAEEEALLGLS